MKRHPREMMCLKPPSGVGRGKGGKGNAKKQNASAKKREEFMKTLRPITEGAVKAAWNELHKEHDVVRICDLRRSLNWPRYVFDEMIRSLRNSMAVNMAQAEERQFTKDELADCWMDENGYRMGTISWN